LNQSTLQEHASSSTDDNHASSSSCNLEPIQTPGRTSLFLSLPLSDSSSAGGHTLYALSTTMSHTHYVSPYNYVSYNYASPRIMASRTFVPTSSAEAFPWQLPLTLQLCLIQPRRPLRPSSGSHSSPSTTTESIQSWPLSPSLPTPPHPHSLLAGRELEVLSLVPCSVRDLTQILKSQIKPQH